jgi:hypothetical protein
MRVERALSICLSLSTASCSLFLEYPELPTTETECWNGVDDDGNGEPDCQDDACAPRCVEGTEFPGTCDNEIDDDEQNGEDCDDAACAGSCPEDEPSSCTNGRDDDGDGVTDADDAACWPVLPDLLVTSCATVGGGQLDLADPTAGRYTLDAGAPSAGPIAPAFSLHNYFGDTLRPADIPALAASTLTLRGRFREAHIDIALEPSTQAFVALVPIESAPLGGRLLANARSRAVGVLLDSTEGTATVIAPGASRTAEGIALGSRLQLTLRYDGADGLVLEVSRDGTVHVTLPIPGALASAAIPQSRMAVQVSGSVVVHRFSVDVDGDRPCGFDSPEIADPVFDLGASTSVARGPSRWCALVIGCEALDLGWSRTFTPWFSTDGIAWRRAPTTIVPSSTLRPVSSAAVAWDESRSAFVAAVLHAGSEEAEIRVLQSPDCQAWTASSDLPPMTLPAPAPASGCDASTDVEWASVSIVRSGAERTQIVYANESGGRTWLHTAIVAQRSFAWLAPIEIPSVLDAALPISVVAVGERDAALIHRLASAETSIGLSVWQDGGEMRRVAPSRALLAPSGEDNSFDRFALRSATLVWDPVDPRLYYAGRGDTRLLVDRPLGAVGSARFQIGP